MYDVNTQGIDKCMINVKYYLLLFSLSLFLSLTKQQQLVVQNSMALFI